MPRWMLTCKDHAALASHCMDRKLSAWERINMKLHKWLCPPCEEIVNQFDTIRQACRSVHKEDQDVGEGSTKLSEEAREKLKAALKQHSK